MAERALATAFVNIVPGTKDFESTLKAQLSGTMPAVGDDSGKGFTKGFGGALKGIGGVLTASLGVGAVIGFTKSLVDAGEAELQGNARLENIAKSMGIFGNQADTVAKRLENLSGVQQLSLGIDDDVIKSTQAKLLTFKDLAKSADTAGGSFDRATMAALDLAAAGFGTAESNAVQLGKALQDPIKGLTALARSGVTFTEAEKERIKTLVESNQIGEAQNLVLKAIETQVGGTAAATTTASDKMEQGWANLKETVGLALLPAFNDLAGVMTDTVLPALTQFFDDFKNGKTPLNLVTDAITNLINYIKDNWSWISMLAGAIIGVTAAVKAWQLATDLVQVTMTALNVVIGIATAAQAGYAAASYGAAGATYANTGAATLGRIAYLLFSGTLWANVTAWVANTASAVANTLAMQAAYLKIILFEGASKAAAAAQWLFNAALTANPIGLVIAAVAALVAGLVWFFTQTKVGQETWKNFTSFMTTAFQSAGRAIGVVWDGILSAGRGIFNGLSSSIEGFINGFIGGINAIIAPLNNLLGIVRTLSGGAIDLKIPNVPSVKLPRLASGGFVDKATTAIIGEAGPEVVTPLKDFERMMGMGNGNGPSITYVAAPNNSLDAEQALFQAIKRAKVVGAW